MPPLRFDVQQQTDVQTRKTELRLGFHIGMLPTTAADMAGEQTDKKIGEFGLGGFLCNCISINHKEKVVKYYFGELYS